MSLIFGHEQPQLVRKVEVGLVVGRRRKQDAAAFVFRDILLDRAIAASLAVAQVVALVDQHDAIAAKSGSSRVTRVTDSTFATQPVLGDVVLPHLHEVLRADDSVSVKWSS